MTARVLAEPISPFRDARGFVIEPMTTAELAAQRNVHVVWTAPGAVRGNHYHVQGTEVAMVFGPALVRYRDADGLHDLEASREALYRFTFPPLVPHAYGALGPVPMLVMVFNTHAHDSKHPDAVRDEILDAAALAAWGRSA